MQILERTFVNCEIIGANAGQVVYLPALLQSGPRQSGEGESADSYDEVVVPTVAKRIKLQRLMTDHCVDTSQTFRQKHGLAEFGTREGSPYSSTIGAGALDKMHAREMDVVDVAMLHAMKYSGGGIAVPSDLLVQVSSMVNRAPWTIGHLISPGTNSKYWYRNKILTEEQVLRVLGWDVEELETPSQFKPRDMRVLVGNTISPPVIGGIIAAILAQVSFGDNAWY